MNFSLFKFACQTIETIFNEHANFAQRNQMLMEFYDPTFALFNVKAFKNIKRDSFEGVLG